jgi:hypothetical protein
LPNLPEHVPPRFTRIAVALEFRQRRVQDLPLGGCGFIATDEIGFVQLRKTGEKLRPIAGGQARELIKNLGFAHGGNLAFDCGFGKQLLQ